MIELSQTYQSFWPIPMRNCRHVALCPPIHLNPYLVSLWHSVFTDSVIKPNENNLRYYSYQFPHDIHSFAIEEEELPKGGKKKIERASQYKRENSNVWDWEKKSDSRRSSQQFLISAEKWPMNNTVISDLNNRKTDKEKVQSEEIEKLCVNNSFKNLDFE